MPFRDVVNLYDVKNNPDRGKPVEISIFWTRDGMVSVIYVNDYPSAVVDFKEKSCFCRTGLPLVQPGMDWSLNGHEWNEAKFEKIASK
ncbi:MAG: DUF2251 domain-containing protein [Spirochaetes bacterium]|nr:DUF2251 domain-containing protein [Spirochaetota bacterium]